MGCERRSSTNERSTATTPSRVTGSALDAESWPVDAHDRCVVRVRQLDAFNNVTAAGSGTIQGNRFSFDFQNAWGLFGTGFLDMSGGQLAGELSSPNGIQQIVLS